VRVRLDELCSFIPRALDPTEVKALHDMRIAAKRLRYILELSSPFFGPYAATAAKQARGLQDVIGEIHDCDVLLPWLQARLNEVQAADAAVVRALAGSAPDLAPEHSAHAPQRRDYEGMVLFAVHLRARRELLYRRFATRWRRLERSGFRERLEEAVSERPASRMSEPAGRGAAPATTRPEP
jgi:CHAD domain